MSARFDFLIRNGDIVTSVGFQRADVGIRDGRIAEIGKLSEAVAENLFDATGMHVLPGLIDTQVHFREPGLEHKEDLESGSRAAIMGGVTTFFEMPNTIPNTTTEGALGDKLHRARGRAWADHAFFVGASTENIHELRKLEMLPGTPGIKIFIGSSTGSLLVENDSDIERVLEAGSRPCPVHAEDEARLRERKRLLSDKPHAREHPYLRDEIAAEIATRRMIDLVRSTGRPVHILHVSTLNELPLLAAAKSEGLPITCEATPQHLTFCADDYERLGNYLQMNPPVRTKEHRDAIRQAVADGLFDAFGSDHAPHTREEKEKPYPLSPSGMPGVQTMLGALLQLVQDGLIDLPTLVRMGSERPAELYGVRNKGRIQSGFDADIVVLDLSASQPVTQDWLQSKCGWSPWEGTELPGRIAAVWLRGEQKVADGTLIGAPTGQPVEFHWKSSP